MLHGIGSEPVAATTTTKAEHMWKPGSDAPSPGSRSPSRSPPPAGENSGDASSTKKAGKKRLSSGTMGMRFMKRKAEAAEAAKKQAEEEEKAKAEREAMEWTTTGDGGEASGASEDDAVMVPLSATAADVYGVGAAIIGRRSFGNFNKAVEDTWAEAIESKSQERAGARAEKQQITDEELLQRYEKYVRGEGDMSGKKSPSIGNLQKKRKKKNKNREGGDKRQK